MSRIYFIQKTKDFVCITTIRQSDHAVQETREIFLSLFKRLKMKIRHHAEIKEQLLKVIPEN